LNVNVPDISIDQLQGLKATALGKRHPPEPHREEISDKGVRHCWLGGVYIAKCQDWLDSNV